MLTGGVQAERGGSRGLMLHVLSFLETATPRRLAIAATLALLALVLVAPGARANGCSVTSDQITLVSCDVRGEHHELRAPGALCLVWLALHPTAILTHTLERCSW